VGFYYLEKQKSNTPCWNTKNSNRKTKIKYSPIAVFYFCFSIRFLSIPTGRYFIFVFSITFFNIPTGRYFIFVFLLEFLVFQQGGILFLFFY
jgi:hypothetical protein